jgi:hypothetical protein
VVTIGYHYNGPRRAGSPAEMRPGGACGADACSAHAQTPRRDRSTGPDRAMCPCLLAQISKNYM